MFLWFLYRTPLSIFEDLVFNDEPIPGLVNGFLEATKERGGDSFQICPVKMNSLLSANIRWMDIAQGHVIITEHQPYFQRRLEGAELIVMKVALQH